MAKTETLVESGIKIMDTAEDKFLLQVEKSSEELFKELMKLFDNIDISNGKLNSTKRAEEFLLTLDKRIEKALEKSGYNQGVGQYVTNFDKITANVIAVQDQLNGFNILASQLNPFQKVAVSDTITKLLGAGINNVFTAPIRQALYRSILLGQKASDAEQIIRDFTLGAGGKEGVLTRYATQVARDSLGQYKGLIQANIVTDLGLNAGRYVGSIIKDSRAQCAKWASEGLIKLDKAFEKELQKAIDGTLCFPVQGVRKCSSGMIPSTTDIPTFFINRGGYNCRHDLLPTKVFKK